MWQNLFFDLDGTLTDPGEGITSCVQRTLADYGILVKKGPDLDRFVGPPLGESFKRYYGFDEEKAAEAVKRYQSYFRAEGIAKNEVYPGIPELLARLQGAGKNLVLATSKPLVFAEEILSRFGLKDYFSFRAGSELDGRRSRKADVIAYGLEGAGLISPAEVVMIGDREHDIFGAKEMGLASIGVLYGYGNRAEFTAAGADYIVDSVAALGDLLLG